MIGRKQTAVVMIQNGKVVEFQFASTGDLELDAAIHKDFERVKDRIQLLANIQEDQRRVNITFPEESFKR